MRRIEQVTCTATGPELQPVAQEGPDELRRFVEFHAADLFAHAVQAGALVAQHRPAPLPARRSCGRRCRPCPCFPRLCRSRDVPCSRERQPRNPPCGAARPSFRPAVPRLGVAGETHRLIDATREIDHLVRFRRGRRAQRFGQTVGPRHRGQPLGKPQRMQPLRGSGHRPGAENPVHRVGQRQHGAQGVFQPGETAGRKLPGGTRNARRAWVCSPVLIPTG